MSSSALGEALVRQAAIRVARSIENYLTRKLKLVINHQKSRVCRIEGVAL